LIETSLDDSNFLCQVSLLTTVSEVNVDVGVARMPALIKRMQRVLPPQIKSIRVEWFILPTDIIASVFHISVLITGSIECDSWSARWRERFAKWALVSSDFCGIEFLWNERQRREFGFGIFSETAALQRWIRCGRKFLRGRLSFFSFPPYLFISFLYFYLSMKWEGNKPAVTCPTCWWHSESSNRDRFSLLYDLILNRSSWPDVFEVGRAGWGGGMRRMRRNAPYLTELNWLEEMEGTYWIWITEPTPLLSGRLSLGSYWFDCAGIINRDMIDITSRPLDKIRHKNLILGRTLRRLIQLIITWSKRRTLPNNNK